MNVHQLIEIAGDAIEVVGVSILVIGAVLATLVFARRWATAGLDESYEEYRENLGRAILLGLEFLVIGDIIVTVAIEMTFENLGILAVIVLIRTFLSFALEIELTGTLPWRQREVARSSGPGGRVGDPAGEDLP